MKIKLMIAAALGLTMLGGCAVYSTGYPPGGYYTYDYYGAWGYDGGGNGHGRHSGGGRSEPGNESGMYGSRGGGHGGGAGTRTAPVGRAERAHPDRRGAR